MSPTIDLQLAIALRHPDVPQADPRWEEALRQILAEAGFTEAEISLAVVDDVEIHQVNREFLNHDEPTDVVTFELDRQSDVLDGEIVVSFDTARRMAAELGWPAADELLLYVVHGALHLAGYDDLDDQARPAMRAAEVRYLKRFGLHPPASKQA